MEQKELEAKKMSKVELPPSSCGFNLDLNASPEEEQKPLFTALRPHLEVVKSTADDCDDEDYDAE